MKLIRRTRTAAAAAAVSITAVVVGLVGVPAAFAASSATATPSTNLHDGQILSVSGSGLPVNTTIQIMECQGTVSTPPPDNSACDGNTLDTQATSDGSGAFTNAAGDANGDLGFKVYALGTPGSSFPNSTIRCDVSHACVLYVGVDQNNFSAAHTFVDIAFAAPPATVRPPVSPSPQAMTVANLGAGNVTVNYGTATDSNGVAETINPSSAVVTNPTHGTLTSVSPGVFKYTNTDGSATTDSFVVGGATATCGSCSPSTSAAGNNVTVNVTIQAAVAFPTDCDVTTQANCALKQIIVVPVTGADLTMWQNGTPPVVDTLSHTLVGTNCSGPAVTLNGKPQNACGVMAPVQITNARGSDAGWSLTGQISDFLDPAAPPTTTCDSAASFSNHCIPGGNLSWGPVAGLAHDLVPGDVAKVKAGNPVAAASLLPAVLQSSGPLAGTPLQSASAPAPLGGLHDAAQTLCSADSTTSGGTFACGANLVVAVPASAFAPGAPGYQATLTLTLA